MALGPPPLSSSMSIAGMFAMWPKPWANWLTRAWQILSAAEEAGTTANRPTTQLWVPRPYFDTTLGLPIWWNGSNWIDASGSVV